MIYQCHFQVCTIIIFIKMFTVRYLREQYTDPDISKQREEGSSQNSAQKSNIDQSTQALNSLKHTDEFIDQIKRRLSLLQIQQDKNKRKAIQNQHKIQQHSKVRQSAAWEVRNKQRYRQKVLNQLQRSKSKIQNDKIKLNAGIKAIRDEILENKKSQYTKVREKSSQIDKSIEKFKKQDQEIKIIRRKKVNEMEQRQRQHISEYFVRKKASFRQNSLRESFEFKKKTVEKSAILAELANIEKAMIQRQSSSRAALDETKRKLQKIKVKATMKKQKSAGSLKNREMKNPQLY